MRRRYSFATVLVGKNCIRREGLARILRSENFRILASVSCADDLHARKLQSCAALFLIVHAGDDFGAVVAQIGWLRERHPGGRVAILADHYRPNELASACRAGAAGYFVDVMTCDVFLKSIELVMMGETVFPPEFLSTAFDVEEDRFKEVASYDADKAELVKPDDGASPQLSPREKSILRCLIEGDSNKCIARKIDIAEATVKVHVKAILRKIRVQNRTQAAIWGMNNRSLAPPLAAKSLHLDPGANKPFATTAADLPEIQRIEAEVPLAVINHTNSFEVSRGNGRIQKGVNLKADGAIRIRK
jgi:DNA-binding NarL/FixJ family response regulator